MSRVASYPEVREFDVPGHGRIKIAGAALVNALKYGAKGSANGTERLFDLIIAEIDRLFDLADEFQGLIDMGCTSSRPLFGGARGVLVAIAGGIGFVAKNTWPPSNLP